MKKVLEAGRLIAVMCSVVLLASCTSSYSRIDITKEVLGSFPAFASEVDTAAIQLITVRYADKRFYSSIEHSAISVTYHVAIHNSGVDTLSLHLSDSTEYAAYRQDTVGWLATWKIKDLEHFQIAPSETKSILISNIGFLGGAFFQWEDLFHVKDNYTHDILRILPDIKVYYNRKLVLPSKRMKILLINYKDDWFSRIINHLSGTPYSFESDIIQNDML